MIVQTLAILVNKDFNFFKEISAFTGFKVYCLLEAYGGIRGS